MNERIKKLIEKGNMEGLADVIDCEAGEEGLGVQLLEDFVKLVVKECSSIYSTIDNGNTVHGTDNYLEALHRAFLGA